MLQRVRVRIQGGKYSKCAARTGPGMESDRAKAAPCHPLTVFGKWGKSVLMTRVHVL